MGVTTTAEKRKSVATIEVNGKSTDVEVNNAENGHSKIGVVQAITHLFKGLAGAGLMAMGDCFKNGGLVGATIVLPIIAIIVLHCDRMLIRASIAISKKTPEETFIDYAETVEKSFEYGPKPLRRFSKLISVIVKAFLCTTQFGCCSIYFIFITDNLHQVFVQNGINLSPNMVMLITLLPVMLPSLLTEIKHITPVSMIANFALLFGLVATLAIAFLDGPLPSISERNLTTNGPQMALFFGTAFFSYESIALILPIRNAMRVPEKFNSRFGVLDIAIFSVTALYIFTGIVSYIRWGEEVQGSITLNLDPKSISSQVVKIIVAFGVFFGYPIQFMVLIQIIWGPIEQNNQCAQKFPITLEVMLRFFMVLLTFGAALAVPKLGLFISLFGGFVSSTLALVFPVMVDFVIRAQMPKSLNAFIYLKNIAILVFAVFAIIICTFQSIVEIIRAFHL